MSEIELKSCPVCGSENVTSVAGFVVCKNCNVSTTVGVTQEESNRLQNTRPLEDALRARAEKAEAMVESLIEAGDRIADNLEFIDGTNCSESLDEWDALVAGWKSPANGEVKND